VRILAAKNSEEIIISLMLVKTDLKGRADMMKIKYITSIKLWKTKYSRGIDCSKLANIAAKYTFVIKTGKKYFALENTILFVWLLFLRILWLYSST